jgi:hypothetical protein
MALDLSKVNKGNSLPIDKRFNLSKSVKSTKANLNSNELNTKGSKSNNFVSRGLKDGKVKKRMIAIFGFILIFTLSGTIYFAVNNIFFSLPLKDIIAEIPQSELIETKTIDKFSEEKNLETVDNENSTEINSNRIDVNEFKSGNVVKKKINPIEKSTNIDQLTSTSALTKNSIDIKASEVIRGDFGNGKVRMKNLGADYKTIQFRVNELYLNKLLDNIEN